MTASVNVTDEVLDMFDRCLAEVVSKARRKALETRHADGAARDDIVEAFQLVARVMLAKDVPDEAVRHHAFAHVTRHRLGQLLDLAISVPSVVDS